MVESRDPGLEILLDLDGVAFAAGSSGDHMVKFVVKQVPSSPERPHGLSYSLTLHDEKGARLVGFDNAHAAPARRRRGKAAPHDHRHRLGTTRIYEYRDAASLLADFWTEVISVLKERGVYP
jgi:hypothetical protein